MPSRKQSLVRLPSRLLTMSLVLQLSAAVIASPDAQAQQKDAASAAAASKASTKPAPKGPALSIDAYLDQVSKQNDEYQRSEKAERGYKLRSGEWHLMTGPNFFANVTYSNDETQNLFAATQGSGTEVTSYSLGLQQVTSFGLTGKLTYSLVDTELSGTTPAYPESYTAGPKIELSQSLWRNFFGKETRANRDAARAGILAQQYGEEFTKIQLRTNAEDAYWDLAVAREAVVSSRESLERANRTRDLMQRQSRLQLSDRADFLQAEAAVAGRQVQLQQAIDEEKAAARKFNTLRQIDSLDVNETLSTITDQMIMSLTIPERRQARADLRASEQQAIAARAQAVAAGETYRPDLKLVASAGIGTRSGLVTGTAAAPTVESGSQSNAISNSFDTDHPNYSVGLTFTMPLERGIASDSREGNNLVAEAAENSLRRKAFDNERAWIELNQQFNEMKNRLNLATKLEGARKVMLDAERERHRRGRSTIFQVIQFEEDYATAQLNRIRMQAAILSLNSQLKTFGGAQ